MLMPRRQVTRTAAASQPSDTKHEILIWQVKREQREAEERQRELEELDRDTRTVFAYNLSTKAGERDLFEFFTRAGGVRGCYCMVGSHATQNAIVYTAWACYKNWVQTIPYGAAIPFALLGFPSHTHATPCVAQCRHGEAAAGTSLLATRARSLGSLLGFPGLGER